MEPTLSCGSSRWRIADRDLWVVVFGTKPTYMKDEEWVVLEITMRSLIMICLVDSISLTVSKEKIEKLFERSRGSCIRLNPWLIHILCGNICFP
jgi:hypothetical protein